MNRLLLTAFVATVGLLLAGPREGVGSGVPAFLDTDGNGELSESERQAFTKARQDAQGGIFERWDLDKDGDIDSVERDQAIAHMREVQDNQRRELFGGVAGPDGLLTLSEAITLIPPFSQVPLQVAERLFALLDLNGDGSVSEEEFLRKLNRGGGKDDDAGDDGL